MNQLTKQDARIENLRAFAIVVVMLGHSIILYSDSWHLYQTARSSQVFNYLKSFINLFQMPLFFSISGYLFVRTGGKLSFWQYIFRKCKRLLIPFLFIGFCYMIPLKLLLHYPSYSGKSLLGIGFSFLCGEDSGHLWFLPVLFLFFFVSYFILHLFGKKFWIWASLTAASFTLTLVRFPNSPFCHYLNYYCSYFWGFTFGAAISQLDLNRCPTWLSICFICAAAIAGVFSISQQHPILSLFASATIVLSCYTLVSKNTNRFVQSISRYSFGLYLFHSPLIYITFTFLRDSHPLLVFALNFFAFGALAYVVAVLAQKTPLKYLIGSWK